MIFLIFSSRSETTITGFSSYHHITIITEDFLHDVHKSNKDRVKMYEFLWCANIDRSTTRVVEKEVQKRKRQIVITHRP